jgi:hypothetical protein
MFRTPAPPPLPTHAPRRPIPDSPIRDEPRAHTFGRDVARYLTDMLADEAGLP